jgi:hypothetical protein
MDIAKNALREDLNLIVNMAMIKHFIVHVYIVTFLFRFRRFIGTSKNRSLCQTTNSLLRIFKPLQIFSLVITFPIKMVVSWLNVMFVEKSFQLRRSM